MRRISLTTALFLSTFMALSAEPAGAITRSGITDLLTQANRAAARAFDSRRLQTDWYQYEFSWKTVEYEFSYDRDFAGQWSLTVSVTKTVVDSKSIRVLKDKNADGIVE